MRKVAFLIFLAFTCAAFAQKNAVKNTKGAEVIVVKSKFMDYRDKKQYKTIKLGGRIWMADNLNYKDNKGKLYDFENVKNACPYGWRLPSKSAWEDLKKEISEADAKTKAKIGWNTQGKWWAVTSIGADTIVYYTVTNSGFGGIKKLDDVESANLSVRCIQNIKAKPSEKKNDMRQYKTVKMGNQLWMAENLNYKTGNSWCFENDDYNCNMYGRLYDWNTAAKACPAGWHLPTKREWSEVQNDSAFAAMLGGNLNKEFNHVVPVSEYKFLDKEVSGNWWGITEYGNTDAYSWHVKANESEFNEKITHKSVGYSVRCVQNLKTGKTNDIKQYKTVKMGNQLWMAENMNFKTGNSWCFEDDDFYCEKYGRLYDWSTAAKVCPAGWHLPSDSEWKDLEAVAGKGIANVIAAVQGGWRDSDAHEYTLDKQRMGEKIGRWRNLNENGIWWTSTIVEAIGSAQVRDMSSSKTFSSTLKNRTSGLSVRCVQNTQNKKISKAFTDARDGKRYGVTVIGNAIWMKDNLNYNAKGSFCYENNPENCERYGYLYDWNAAQSACPANWRLPSHEDWLNLIENSGKGSAGKKLKSWQWDGTDDYGFSALPGGFTKAQGFSEIRNRGYWWTSDANGPSAKCKYMSSGKDDVVHYEHSKSTGLSVRCVQDCGPYICVLE